MTHVAINDLSSALRDALKGIGYARPDIKVIPASSVDPTDAGESGRRAFVVIVNLDTGARDGRNGSWGGPNPWSSSPVDSAEGHIEIPVNGAVIKGSRGYGPTYAVVYAHPDAFGRMLPAPADDVLTDLEQQAIYCFAAIKGGEYRRDEMRRRNVTSDVVDALVTRGYLKRNRAGATQITTKGRNARTVRN